MKGKKNVKPILNIENENTYFLICWDIFQKVPNTLSIIGIYDKDRFYKKINNFKKEETINQEVIKVEELDIINISYFIKINDNVYLSYNIQDSENSYSTINEIEFYYKNESDNSKVQEILNSIEECELSFENNENLNNLNTLSLTPEGVDIEPIPSEIIQNIELFYSKSTMKSVNKLIKSIKENNKGLSILYGERGTGKTSIIHYISHNLDRIVLYCPNNLLDQTLNNNDFKSFLKSHAKPILIIDDGENIFNDIYSNTNTYTNSILQLVDGLLSDVIELNIIIISNSSLDDIDRNLLEANTFIDSIEFKTLSIEESNKLSKYLKINKKYNKKHKLIDILNKNSKKEDKKIGLK